MLRETPRAVPPSLTFVTNRRLPASLRALGHRPFRYYFFGQAVSILGTWIQQVALAWLVYRLTGSAALLGATSFAGLIPMLLVGPFAGAWVDRHDKRRLLMINQALLFVQATLLATLTWLDVLGPTLIIVMAAILGTLNAFDVPLRQALISRMVGSRDDLPNALALNAMLFNSGRFIGPPLAGLLLTRISEAACFMLNAVSYLALLWAAYAMRVTTQARASGSTAHVFREGLRYAIDTWPVRILIITLALLNITASAYAVLLPIFAKEVYFGDAQTLGLLWGAVGLGGFISTVFLAGRPAVRHTLNATIAGVLLSGVALLVFPLANMLVVSLPALAALGFGLTVSNVGINTVLQAIAPDHLRGRVVSFFSSTRFGFDAIGGLIGGAIATIIGAPWTLVAEAVLLLVVAAWLVRHAAALRRSVTP